MKKAILAQHRNPTVELIPDGADPRLLNSLITLNYHELLPVVAPTDLSLEDPRLVMVGLRTCHADCGRQPVFCFSKHTRSVRSRAYFAEPISRTRFFIIHANGQKFKQAWIFQGKLKWKIMDESRLLRIG